MDGRRAAQLRPAAVPPQKANAARNAVQKAVATQRDAKRVKQKIGQGDDSSGGDALLRGVKESVEEQHQGLGQAPNRLASQGRSADAGQAMTQRENVTTRQKDTQSKVETKKEDQKEQARTEARVTDEGNQAANTTAETSQRVGGAKGQKNGGGGQDQGKKDEQQPASFRLPPAALMAPPPLARPKDVQKASPLRAFAQEIADRIVKHVHVGTNKMGLPEFQIELKSEVLKGLKVKVAGRHGRIRASFSSQDLAVIKQLRGGITQLREALTARGLKVDALDVIEEPA
jgi:hypothetical protein